MLVGDDALVPLTQGMWAVVDAEDAEIAGRRPWTSVAGYRTWYAGAMDLRDGVRVALRLHREVMGLPVGDHRQVDHVNGNGLDNRRRNLRVATAGQNLANKASREGSLSKYKGVSPNRGRSKWVARITVDGRTTFLGTFDDETTAALAYDQAAIEAWGHFARPNFP